MRFRLLTFLSFIVILLLTACGKEQTLEEELKSYEEEDAKTAEEAKKLEEDLNKQLKEEETKLDKRAIGSDNKLYGEFTNFEAEQVAKYIYYDKKKKIRYFTDNYYIYLIEKEFDKKLRLNLEMDKDFLIEHAKDFMEDDAVEIEQPTEKDFVFHSNKINKNYYITYASDVPGSITRVIISQNK
ncbi:hypothetical protein [Macrococcoides canis]|uniref:hypothetical protein n=1 Tax=Macrococcoides canis TaxID=1855823 RepID=UPI0020B866FA|nr:hypothetical protein [Macrococcus canis]UTH10947.1 hypothetical protein KFV10_08495 [Macrococcus canis]